MNIEANAASVTGRRHRAREENRQDAHVVIRGKRADGVDFVVAAIADGCGSAARSEVGAAISVAAAAREAARRIASGERVGPSVAHAFRRAAHALLRVTNAVGATDDADDFVESHLLATLLVVAHDGAEIAIGARGDGAISWGEELVVLERDGAPDYLAYELTGAKVEARPYLATRSAETTKRVAIATDGLPPAMLHAAFGRHGRALQRWLNVESREGGFEDDATLVTIELTGGAS